MTASTLRRYPWLSAGAFLALALIAYQIPARMGFTIMNLLRTTRVNLNTAAVNPDRVVFAVGDSIFFDACISDGVDMYLFVHDCAKWHPYLFRWSTSGDGVVRRGVGKLYGVKPGHFTIAVRALGHTDTLSGEIIEPVVLTASTYDTTLRVGEELLVGSQVVPPPGGRRRIEPVTFGDPVGDAAEAIRQEPVPWAYPAAIRLSAHAPAVRCFELTGYHQLTWLKVSVVDSVGMTRQNDRPVDPSRVSCDGIRPDFRAARPTERAPLPVSALGDSDIAAGARKAFALELCVARRRMAADTGGAFYRVTQDLRSCADSVSPLAPEWPITTPGVSKPFTLPGRPQVPASVQFGEDYEVTFSHPVSTDSNDTRNLILSSNSGVLELKEIRTGPPFVFGPQATIQGTELETLKAALACANLYRERNGRDVASLDSLLRFAAGAWAAMDPQERPSTRCRGDRLHFRPHSPELSATTALYESGQFTLQYHLARSGRSFVVRPVRWGESGVLSYALEEPGPIRRTVENRAPVVTDEFYLLDPGSWYFPRSQDAKALGRDRDAAWRSTRCYGVPCEREIR